MFKRRPSPEDIEQVKEALRNELTERPPTIGVIGVSGTGKSSTINAMFKTSLRVSHTVAGTKKFESTEMNLRVREGVTEGDQVKLVVVDAPGLGEDIRLDPGYLAEYRRNLPMCDVVLWVLAARQRAVSLDQQYIEQLAEFHDRFVFGINQVDLVHPADWIDGINLPSERMQKNIDAITADRAAKIADVLGGNAVITPYSAEHGFNLERLFETLIDSIPEKRRFIYQALKGFSYHDFMPALPTNGSCHV